MEYSEKKHGPVLVLTPRGNLDIMNYQALKQRLAELDESGESKQVVVDLSLVEYIASSGWAVLISHARRARRAGGALVLARMPDTVASVYDSMSVESLLPHVETLEAAVAAAEINPGDENHG